MNNAEKYIYKVYQTKNFSEAAKELYISQPSLSATIKNLEKQLGYHIFNRKTLPVTLTREGEIYIEYLEQVIELERYRNHRITSLQTPPTKTLFIGGSNSAAFFIIPKICKEFLHRFPNTNIKIDVGELGEVNNLFEKLNQGILDLVINYGISPSGFNSVKLWEEKYVVVARKDCPGVEKLAGYALSYDEILNKSYSSDKEITDLSLLKNIRIFKPGSVSSAREIFPELFKNPSPQCQIVNFRRTEMHYNLMSEGLGGLLTTLSSVLSKAHNPENLYFFSVYHPDNVRNVMICYRKDAPLSQHAKDFIEIARDICSSNEFISTLKGGHIG